MGKESLTSFIKNAQMALTKHSPEILTGIGIAGYDMLSEPLGGNYKLLAKFAGTKKQYFFHRRILF